ncbi:MAG: hypothetical protein ABFC62_01540 [Clostridiaceae bacterium]
MKKIALIVVALSILFTARPAFANSAPIRYEAEGPHFTMGVLEDCEIGIEHEDLGFDIHFEEEHPSFMDVTASYEMLNHGEKQTVTMAFPLLFTLENADAFLNASVTADGVAVEARRIFISSAEHLSSVEARAGSQRGYDAQAYLKTLEIENLLSYASSPSPGLAEYQKNAPLDIYTLQGKSDADFLEIRWPDTMRKEPLIYGSGIDHARFMQEQGECFSRIWLTDDDADVHIAVQYEPNLKQALVIAVYNSEKGPKEYTLAPGPKLVYEESVTMEAFLLSVCMREFLARYPKAAPFENEAELYYLMFKELQRPGQEMLAGALLGLYAQDMMGLLVYEIPFEAGQARRVEVSYRQLPPYFDGRAEIWADYAYVTSPAEHYRDFGTLDVTVRFIDRPKQLPSNVRSETAGVLFEELDADTYFTSIDGLPQGPLLFSVICADRPSPIWSNLFLYGIFLFPLFVVGGVLIAPIGLIAYAIYRRRKKKKAASQNALPEGESIPEKEGYYKRPQ